MDAGDVLGRSVVEQAALVRSGEISARELVDAALAEIERSNPALNAFVAPCPERALVEAEAVRAGDRRRFCGVPVGIKDLLSAVEGLPTSEGSRAFGDWVADHDSAHVRRLREAGAIVVGRTNTPELGLRPVTENARFGRRATRGARVCRRAARRAAAPPRSPPGWSRSATAATSAARSASQPRAAGWWG